MNITTDDLLRIIGGQTVELQMLRAQIAELQAVVSRLQPTAATEQ